MAEGGLNGLKQGIKPIKRKGKAGRNGRKI
jgi:hypothetical protein